MKRYALAHRSACKVEILEENCPPPGEGEVLVQTRYSGISAGTEGLIYQGLFPEDMPQDEHLPSLKGEFRYPFRYGYSCVGAVTQVGEGVPYSWMGRRVFAFHPHASHFTIPLPAVIPLPDTVRDEDAVFLPNMETAVNFLQDGRPLLGEAVVVFGLGVVGLLTTSLLAQFPLGFLGCVDRLFHRRRLAESLGATICLDTGEFPQPPSLRQALESAGLPCQGADLVYELSGYPEVINQALGVCGFNSRIVIGSWYGKKTAPVSLGGVFHRQRITILSSQVSTIHPSLTGRWDKERRFRMVLHQLGKIKPGNWITHRFPLFEADKVFQWLINAPQEGLQVIFTYT